MAKSRERDRPNKYRNICFREESHSWSSAPVLKTGKPKGFASSNLASSAKKENRRGWTSSVFFFGGVLLRFARTFFEKSTTVIKSWTLPACSRAVNPLGVRWWLPPMKYAPISVVLHVVRLHRGATVATVSPPARHPHRAFPLSDFFAGRGRTTGLSFQKVLHGWESKQAKSFLPQLIAFACLLGGRWMPFWKTLFHWDRAIFVLLSSHLSPWVSIQ